MHDGVKAVGMGFAATSDPLLNRPRRQLKENPHRNRNRRDNRQESRAQSERQSVRTRAGSTTLGVIGTGLSMPAVTGLSVVALRQAWNSCWPSAEAKPPAAAG